MGMEMSKDGDVLTVAAGSKVIFLDANRFEKLKEVNIPSPTYTASLHMDKEIFVCGGEDLKLYKFDYQTGIELRTSKVTLVQFTVLDSLQMESCMPVVVRMEL